MLFGSEKDGFGALGLILGRYWEGWPDKRKS